MINVVVALAVGERHKLRLQIVLVLVGERGDLDRSTGVRPIAGDTRRYSARDIAVDHEVLDLRRDERWVLQVGTSALKMSKIRCYVSDRLVVQTLHLRRHNFVHSRAGSEVVQLL